MARMLEEGSRGSDVAELQRELNAAQGGPDLVVDGDFGPRTKSAVEAFQRAHHLTVDGVVGPQTRAALARARHHHAPAHHGSSHAPHHHHAPPPPPHHGRTIVALSQLEHIMPGITSAHAHLYVAPLNDALVEFHIDTRLRAAAFLGQIAEESVELNYFEEIASGWEYDISRNPSLARELGNTHYGDGPRYKGRGPIQLTGRSNYIRAGEALHVDLVDHPTRAALPSIGFRTAGWYWVTHGLNGLADERDYRDITLRINGGLNGYSTRIYYYDRALAVL
ncbi:MAG TPA: peptidoglycan-binding protein [Minicystis sp.]|nr:peptidoglycan-binding protein [Minicystis sp.]